MFSGNRESRYALELLKAVIAASDSPEACDRNLFWGLGMESNG